MIDRRAVVACIRQAIVMVNVGMQAVAALRICSSRATHRRLAAGYRRAREAGIGLSRNLLTIRAVHARRAL